MARKQGSIQELLSLMFVIGRYIRGEADKRTGRGHSHSMLQFEALRYVKERGNPLMRDLAAHFAITPPAATLLVDGLVEEGLLGRLLDAKDRRAVRIDLTAKGKKFLAQGMQKKAARLRKMFSALTPSERAVLAGILEKMAKNTGQTK